MKHKNTKATVCLLLAVALFFAPVLGLRAFALDEPPAGRELQQQEPQLEELPACTQSESPVSSGGAGAAAKQGAQGEGETEETEQGTQAPVRGLTPEARGPGTQSAGTGFVFVAQQSYGSSYWEQVKLPVFSVRKQGTAEWTPIEVTGVWNFVVPGSLLEDDVPCEFVLTYYADFSGKYRLYKVFGTVTRGGDGSWAHTLGNLDTGLLTAVPGIGETGYTLILSKAADLYYEGQYVWFNTTPGGAKNSLTVYDAMDGTPLIMMPISNIGRVAAFLPKKGGVNVTGPYKTITDAPGGDANVNALAYGMRYTASVENYFDASGLYKPNTTRTGAPSATGGELFPDDANHTVADNHGNVLIAQFKFAMKPSKPVLTVSGLFTGSEVVVDPPGAGVSLTTTEEGELVEFSLPVAGAAQYSVELRCPGARAIPLTIEVAQDASVRITNLAEAAAFAETLTYDEAAHILAVKQRISLEPKEEDSGYLTVSSGNLFDYIRDSNAVSSLSPVRGKFTIRNTSAHATYRAVGYEIVPYSAPFTELVRGTAGTERAIKKVLDYVNPGWTHTPGKVDYIYNFDEISGGYTLSQALLLYYQSMPQYSGITSLKQLPPKVIANEIFPGPNHSYDANMLDLSYPNLQLLQNGEYCIMETDPGMQELAGYLLYEHALRITMDSALDPLRQHIDADADPTPWQSYCAFRDNTPENAEVMQRIMDALPDIGPGEAWEFNNFVYGLNGTLIHNPFVLSEFDFSFEFKVKLQVIGVEGIAFEDADGDGIYTPGTDMVLPGVAVELWAENGTASLQSTATSGTGRYEFAQVPPGRYYAVVAKPTGYTAVPTQPHEAGNKFGEAGKTDVFAVAADDALRFNAGFEREATQPETYTVTYTAPGGTGGTIPTDAARYMASEMATVKTGEPTCAGHIFKGWQASHNGRTYKAGAQFAMPAQNVTLTALWEPNMPLPASSTGQSQSRSQSQSQSQSYARSQSISEGGTPPPPPTPPPPSQSVRPPVGPASRPHLASSFAAAVSSSARAATSFGPAGVSSSVAGAAVSAPLGSAAPSVPPGAPREAGLGDGRPPLGGFAGRASWSLVNLLLSILALLTALVLIANLLLRRKRAKTEEPDEAPEGYAYPAETQRQPQETRKKGGILTRVFSAALGAITLVLFFLLEDLTLPLTLINHWTPLFLVLYLVHLVLLLLSIWLRHKEKEEGEDANPDPMAPAL